MAKRKFYKSTFVARMDKLISVVVGAGGGGRRESHRLTVMLEKVE